MQADTTSSLPPRQARDAYLMGAPKPACQEERERTADGIHALQQFHDGEVESILRLLCKVFDTNTASMTFLTGKCIHILEVRPVWQVCWLVHNRLFLRLPPRRSRRQRMGCILSGVHSPGGIAKTLPSSMQLCLNR